MTFQMKSQIVCKLRGKVPNRKLQNPYSNLVRFYCIKIRAKKKRTSGMKLTKRKTVIRKTDERLGSGFFPWKVKQEEGKKTEKKTRDRI